MYKHFMLMGAATLSVACMDALAESDIINCKAKDECPKVEVVNYQNGEPTRLLSKQGEVLCFKVPSNADKVAVSETPRSTRIAKDLATFRDIAKKVGGMKDALVDEEEKCFQYRQRNERSLLSLTPQSGDTQLGKADFILGDEEHWWLSADVGLTNIKQLTLDKNGNPTVKEKPSSFYIGVNYKIGDVFHQGNKLSGLDRLSAKFLFHASTTPSDSMGAGLAYDLNVVTLFVARVWTKHDASVGGTIGTTQSTVAGISFDISKGLDWVNQ